MRSRPGQTIVRNLASPYVLALASFVIFLFGWACPPQIYTRFMSEPDYMFLDQLTLVFYAACVLSFCAGAYLAGKIWAKSSNTENAPLSRRSPLPYLLFPIGVGVLFCCGCFLAIGQHFDLLGLLKSGQGGIIKQAIHSGEVKVSIFGTARLFTTAILWWAADRGARLEMTPTQRSIFRVSFAVAVLADVLACIATVDRTALMPLLIGLIIIGVDRSARSGRLTLKSAALRAIGGACLLTGLFVGFSYLRGFRGFQGHATTFMGYTITSYNRLTALVHGIMHYQFGGRGAYLFQCLTMAKISSLLGLGNFMPDGSALWESEFGSTLSAGLNPMYIWSGTFGYLYSDLGWGALVYLFGVGALAGWAWSRFHMGTILGRVLYPWIAFWVLFWLGWNVLFAVYFLNILVGICFLGLYEFVCEAAPFSSNVRQDLRARSGLIPRV
jgi:hypothetical protein